MATLARIKELIVELGNEAFLVMATDKMTLSHGIGSCFVTNAAMGSGRQSVL